HVCSCLESGATTKFSFSSTLNALLFFFFSLRATMAMPMQPLSYGCTTFSREFGRSFRSFTFTERVIVQQIILLIEDIRVLLVSIV
ncbi:hypothetical protein LINPERHAP1_LOCUS34765, partial [Linum perenne]